MVLLTVCNKEYSIFLKLFLYSLVKTCNMSNIKNIFIVDCGIPDDIKKSILSNSIYQNKIVFISEKNISNDKTHTDNWREIISKKLKYLRALIDEHEMVLLIDVDVMFLNDITKIQLFDNHDFLLCGQPGFVNGDGFYLDLIGCFCLFKQSEASKDFIQTWIDNCKSFQILKFKHVETPALCRTAKMLDKWKRKKSYGIADQDVLCATKLNEKSYTLHFRSNGSGEIVNNDRILSIIDDKMIQHILGRSLNDIQLV